MQCPIYLYLVTLSTLFNTKYTNILVLTEAAIPLTNNSWREHNVAYLDGQAHVANYDHPNP